MWHPWIGISNDSPDRSVSMTWLNRIQPYFLNERTLLRSHQLNTRYMWFGDMWEGGEGRQLLSQTLHSSAQPPLAGGGSDIWTRCCRCGLRCQNICHCDNISPPTSMFKYKRKEQIFLFPYPKIQNMDVGV